MDFYSYLWLREDGTPYYAGKGTGKRAFVRGSHHLRPPTDRARILIFPQASEAAALIVEIALIALIGRKDQGTGGLRNFTDGGDGVTGLRHTSAARLRMSRAKKGKIGHSLTAEHIAAMAAGRVGKRRGPRPAHVLAALHAPEACAKSAATRMGLKRSEETKQKIRVAALAREARKREQI